MREQQHPTGTTDPFGPVVHSYTRAQALDDGILVAVPEEHRR